MTENLKVDYSNVTLKIDDEFHDLIPPLDKEEREGLERDILRDGCIHPIITWNGIIIDGHNRYEICNKHKIPFKILEMQFESRLDAKIWIGFNQLNRRNLQSYAKADIVLKLKPFIAEKAKENERLGGGSGESGRQKSDNPIDTKKELARISGISHDTIWKREKMHDIRADIVSQIEELKKSQEIKVSLDKNNEKTTFADIGESKDKQSMFVAPISRMTPTQKEIIIKKMEDNLAKIEKVEIDLKSGDESLNSAFKEVSQIKKDIDKTIQRMEVAIDGSTKQLPQSVKLLHGDIKESSKQITDNSVDCIITDPPYPHEFMHCYEDLSLVASRVLKPGGYCIVYVGHIHLDEEIALLSKYLKYFWIFAQVHTGHTKLVGPRMVKAGWKPILVFIKPPQELPEIAIEDVITGSGRDKELHDWQQSGDELITFIDTYTSEGDTIYDPFMGSGTTIIAALKRKRKAIGGDIDENNIDMVKKRVGDEI